jgi:hypothetical protein
MVVALRMVPQTEAAWANLASERREGRRWCRCREEEAWSVAMAPHLASSETDEPFREAREGRVCRSAVVRAAEEAFVERTGLSWIVTAVTCSRLRRDSWMSAMDDRELSFRSTLSRIGHAREKTPAPPSLLIPFSCRYNARRERRQTWSSSRHGVMESILLPPSHREVRRGRERGGGRGT